jgi:hypothetical protein
MTLQKIDKYAKLLLEKHVEQGISKTFAKFTQLVHQLLKNPGKPKYFQPIFENYQLLMVHVDYPMLSITYISKIHAIVQVLIFKQNPSIIPNIEIEKLSPPLSIHFIEEDDLDDPIPIPNMIPKIIEEPIEPKINTDINNIYLILAKIPKLKKAIKKWKNPIPPLTELQHDLLLITFEYPQIECIKFKLFNNIITKEKSHKLIIQISKIEFLLTITKNKLSNDPDWLPIEPQPIELAPFYEKANCIISCCKQLINSIVNWDEKQPGISARRNSLEYNISSLCNLPIEYQKYKKIFTDTYNHFQTLPVEKKFSLDLISDTTVIKFILKLIKTEMKTPFYKTIRLKELRNITIPFIQGIQKQNFNPISLCKLCNEPIIEIFHNKKYKSMKQDLIYIITHAPTDIPKIISLVSKIDLLFYMTQMDITIVLFNHLIKHDFRHFFIICTQFKICLSSWHDTDQYKALFNLNMPPIPMEFPNYKKLFDEFYHNFKSIPFEQSNALELICIVSKIELIFQLIEEEIQVNKNLNEK